MQTLLFYLSNSNFNWYLIQLQLIIIYVTPVYAAFVTENIEVVKRLISAPNFLINKEIILY